MQQLSRMSEANIALHVRCPRLYDSLLHYNNDFIRYNSLVQLDWLHSYNLGTKSFTKKSVRTFICVLSTSCLGAVTVSRWISWDCYPHWKLKPDAVCVCLCVMWWCALTRHLVHSLLFDSVGDLLTSILTCQNVIGTSLYLQEALMLVEWCAWLTDSN